MTQILFSTSRIGLALISDENVEFEFIDNNIQRLSSITYIKKLVTWAMNTLEDDMAVGGNCAGFSDSEIPSSLFYWNDNIRNSRTFRLQMLQAEAEIRAETWEISSLVTSRPVGYLNGLE